MISWPNSLYLLPFSEGHPQPREQAPRLVVAARGGDDAHLQPAQLVDLVVVDLRKHDLLAQAERVVAATVEPVRVHAAEVANAGQRDVEQLVQEVPHAPAPKRRLDADGLARAELEGGNRFLRLDELWLLAGDRRHVANRRVERFVVVLRLADADVDNDLVQARHLHDVAVVELLGQLRRDRVSICLQQPRRLVRLRTRRLRSGLLLRSLLLGLRHYCASVLRTRSYGSPQWRQTRARAPDSSTVCLVRVGRPQCGQTSITLE